MIKKMILMAAVVAMVSSPAQSQEYQETTTLQILGDFGVTLTDTSSIKVVSDTGGWLMNDSTAIYEKRPLSIVPRDYLFMIKVNGADYDTFAIDGPDSLTLSSVTADNNPDGVRYTIRVQDAGLGEASSPVIFELPPCDTPAECRILARSLAGGALYDMETWREDRSKSNFDYLNPGDEQVTILPKDDGDYHFVFRAFDDNFKTWRAPSPLLTIQTRVCVVPNVPPTAVNDTATTDENHSVVVAVLGNDSDPDGTIDPQTVTIVGTAANGTSSVNSANGDILYIPNTDFSGLDTFSYTVDDDQGDTSNVAVVSVTVVDTVIIPDPEVREGPDLTDADWVNSWTLKFSFVDPLSVDVQTVEVGDYKLVRPDGSEFEPGSTPIFRNNSYFTVYCEGCRELGEWMMVLKAESVADLNGVYNTLPDTLRWTE